MLLLWPSPHEMLPLFPRYCCVNCSRFVFRNATVNLPKQAFFVTVAGCKDGVLPYWCCGCVGLAVCRNAAVALPMLRLLKPVLRRCCCCCLANAVVVFRTLLLMLPLEQPLTLLFFLLQLWLLVLLPCYCCPHAAAPLLWLLQWITLLLLRCYDYSWGNRWSSCLFRFSASTVDAVAVAWALRNSRLTVVAVASVFVLFALSFTA